MSAGPCGAVVLVLLVTGCSVDASPEVELLVFAGSSLTDSFSSMEERFEATHLGADVVFNFGPSDGLAAQIQSEGTADVFASASTHWMDEVAKEPGVSDRVDFAHNRLVVVTPPGDDAAVSKLEDLAEPGVQVVLAAEGVPVGDYAREALMNAGILAAVTPNIVSNEEDAAGVVTKISSSEADAAIVYASDLLTAPEGMLRSVPIPDDVNVVATYPIAVVAGAARPNLARAFVELVAGTVGQEVLRDHGFETG
jgi:molybdate transport system substrate-binding protein